MKKAVGLIETIGLAAAIEAADAAVKAANVTLLGYENTRGSGKITVKIAGDVGAVKAGVAAAVASASRVGAVYGRTIMPRPHEGIAALIQNIDRGKAARTAEEEPPPAPPETEEAGAGAKSEAEAVTAEAPAAPEAEPAPDEPAMEPETEASAEQPEETPGDAADEDPEPGRCIAMTRSGERCKLPALEGSLYCFVHRESEEKSES
jgi:microcompartment protein CcmL/EutN